MPQTRLIREAQLTQDGVAPAGSAPDPISTPAIPLDDIDIPVGFEWDISTVDIFLQLEFQSGGGAASASTITAFLYAGAVPLGSAQLEQAGPLEFGGFVAPISALWRTILSLPSPVTVFPTDRPFTVAVSALDDPAVASGTAIALSVFRAGSKLTYYGTGRD